MNKSIKGFLFTFIFVLFVIPVCVFAANNGGNNGNGNNQTVDVCKNDWCLYAEGIRLSLYRYTGSGSPISYGSVDYDTDVLISKHGDSSARVASMVGRVDYANNSGLSAYPSSNRTIKNVIKANPGGWKCIFDSSSCKSYQSGLRSQLIAYFGLNGKNPNWSDVINKIGNAFPGAASQLSEGDAQYLYITVEPTLLIYNKSGTKYYGSAYELATFRKNNGKMPGLETVLGGNFYDSLWISSLGSKDDNGFIGKVISPIEPNIFEVGGLLRAFMKVCWNQSQMKTITCGLLGLDYDVSNNVKNAANAKKGYGIGVVWLGEFIKGCSQTCGGYSANSVERLMCAENYCENNPDADGKEKCINKCGYDKVTHTGCPNSTCNAASVSTTTCKESKTVSTDSCNSLGGSNYIVIDCTNATNGSNTNTTTLNYTDDLPKNFLTGLGGFNYSVTLSGKKTCTATFDYKYAQYNYAIATAGVQKNNVKSVIDTELDRYNKLVSTNATENNSNYWKASVLGNTNVKFKVGTGSDAENYTLEKNSTSLTDKVTKQQKNTNNNILYYFASDTKLSKASKSNVSKAIYLNSETRIMYELNTRCFTLKNGRVNLLVGDTKCTDIKRNQFYYGYYSNRTDELVQTTTTVKKSDICLNDTNTCYFTNDAYDCSTDVTYNNFTNKYDVKFNVHGYKAGASITYKFDTSEGNYNSTLDLKKSYSPTSSYEEKEAWVKYNWKGKTITQYCNYIIPKTTPDANTCKVKYNCKNAHDIEQYCKDHWFEDKAGYGSSSECINDCTCIDTKTTSKEYVYRPISLSNPFPDRDPGENWEDHLDLIESDAETYGTKESPKKALYVIKLDATSINKIRKESDDKSIYVRYDKTGDYERKDIGYSFYKSNYVNKTANRSIFVCRNGSGVCE